MCLRNVGSEDYLIFVNSIFRKSSELVQLPSIVHVVVKMYIVKIIEVEKVKKCVLIPL